MAWARLTVQALELRGKYHILEALTHHRGLNGAFARWKEWTFLKLDKRDVLQQVRVCFPLSTVYSCSWCKKCTCVHRRRILFTSLAHARVPARSVYPASGAIRLRVLSAWVVTFSRHLNEHTVLLSGHPKVQTSSPRSSARSLELISNTLAGVSWSPVGAEQAHVMPVWWVYLAEDLATPKIEIALDLADFAVYFASPS